MSDIPYSVVSSRRAVSAVPDGNIEMSLLSIGGRTLDWTQMGQDISGNAVNDNLGSATAMSNDGNIIAVGVIGTDDVNTDVGKVQVYSWNGSDWVQRGTDIIGTDGYGYLGNSLAMSGDGNSFIVGAPSFSGGIGKVFIYVWNGSDWVTRNTQTLQGSTGTYFGSNVAMSNDGNIIAIGEQNSDEGGINSGRVLVYEWNSSTSLWVQRGIDTIVGSAGEQLAWCSLSDYGNVLAVGAFSGQYVKVYSWVEAKYVQRGSTIVGEVSGDVAFRSSLSGDGNTVAIGAELNDGVNGTNSGHVRVFDWNGSAWVKRGADIDGEAAGDQSGRSLQLSASGNTLAIGAISNSGGGAGSGHMRIYIWTGTAWQKLGSDIDGVASNYGGGYISLSGDGTRVIFNEAGHDVGGISNAGRIRMFGINVLGSYTIVPAVGGTPAVTTSNLTPQPEDVRIDYSQSHPVTTSVAVYNASAPTVQLSSNTISTAGNYIVKYTATDADSSSTVKTVKVTKV